MRRSQEARTRLARRNEGLAELRRQGKTVAEIAALFKMSQSTVSTALSKMGVKYPSHLFRCGHDKTPENTIQNGYPRCKTCHREWSREFMRRSREGRLLLERMMWSPAMAK